MRLQNELVDSNTKPKQEQQQQHTIGRILLREIASLVDLSLAYLFFLVFLTNYCI